jgi:hypothetical protein
MVTEKLEFDTRKIHITIDYTKCEPAQSGSPKPKCGFACVKACRLYGRNVLKIENNKPVLSVAGAEEVARLDNECMSCEFNCEMHGTGCIHIDVPLPGLEEYKREQERG